MCTIEPQASDQSFQSFGVGPYIFLESKTGRHAMTVKVGKVGKEGSVARGTCPFYISGGTKSANLIFPDNGLYWTLDIV